MIRYSAICYMIIKVTAIAIIFYLISDSFSFAEQTDNISELTKAIERNSTDIEAYRERGFFYLMGRKYEQAINDYNRCVELNPNDKFCYTQKGIAYYYKGEYEKAIDDLTRAIEIDPSFQIPYNSRGSAYIALKQWDRALKDINKAIKLKPDYFNAYFQRAHIYLSKGMYGRAIDNCEHCLKLRPSNKTVKKFLPVLKKLQSTKVSINNVYLAHADNPEKQVEAVRRGQKLKMVIRYTISDAPEEPEVIIFKSYRIFYKGKQVYQHTFKDQKLNGQYEAVVPMTLPNIASGKYQLQGLIRIDEKEFSKKFIFVVQ